MFYKGAIKVAIKTRKIFILGLIMVGLLCWGAEAARGDIFYMAHRLKSRNFTFDELEEFMASGEHPSSALLLARIWEGCLQATSKYGVLAQYKNPELPQDSSGWDISYWRFLQRYRENIKVAYATYGQAKTHYMLGYSHFVLPGIGPGLSSHNSAPVRPNGLAHLAISAEAGYKDGGKALVRAFNYPATWQQLRFIIDKGDGSRESFPNFFNAYSDLKIMETYYAARRYPLEYVKGMFIQEAERLTAAGDLEAQWILGEAYTLREEVFPGRAEEGVRLLEEAGKAGVTNALIALGRYCMFTDRVEGLKWSLLSENPGEENYRGHLLKGRMISEEELAEAIARAIEWRESHPRPEKMIYFEAGALPLPWTLEEIQWGDRLSLYHDACRPRGPVCYFEALKKTEEYFSKNPYDKPPPEFPRPDYLRPYALLNLINIPTSYPFGALSSGLRGAWAGQVEWMMVAYLLYEDLRYEWRNKEKRAADKDHLLQMASFGKGLGQPAYEFGVMISFGHPNTFVLSQYEDYPQDFYFNAAESGHLPAMLAYLENFVPRKGSDRYPRMFRWAALRHARRLADMGYYTGRILVPVIMMHPKWCETPEGEPCGPEARAEAIAELEALAAEGYSRAAYMLSYNIETIDATPEQEAVEEPMAIKWAYIAFNMPDKSWARAGQRRYERITQDRDIDEETILKIKEEAEAWLKEHPLDESSIPPPSIMFMWPWLKEDAYRNYGGRLPFADYTATGLEYVR